MGKIIEIFFLILITSHFNNDQNSADALKCYTCNFNYGVDTDECLNDPASVIGRPITNCNKKYCTIVRQEAKNPKGHVKTLSRHCADKPLFINEVIEDSDFKTYYRACTTELCNSGSGVSSSSSITDPNKGAGSNIIIPGRSTASSIKFNSILSIDLIAMTCILVKLF